MNHLKTWETWELQDYKRELDHRLVEAREVPRYPPLTWTANHANIKGIEDAIDRVNAEIATRTDA